MAHPGPSTPGTSPTAPYADMDPCLPWRVAIETGRKYIAEYLNPSHDTEDQLQKQVNDLQAEAERLKKQAGDYKSKLADCQSLLDKVKDRNGDPTESPSGGIPKTAPTVNREPEAAPQQFDMPASDPLDLEITPANWRMMPCADECAYLKQEYDQVMKELADLERRYGTISHAEEDRLKKQVEDLKSQVAELQKQANGCKSQLDACQAELDKLKNKPGRAEN
ncbi:hypothetical protein [Streptomyces sp. NPDC015350]|uniref:hypothetical protein n=1 Tax=Streptomyces sp. NPDC015350 TaxID=3364955 RepID=UPI0036FB0391